jgi:hypothetical protein
MDHSSTSVQNIVITASFNLEFIAVFSQYTVYTHINENEGNVTQHTYLQLIHLSGSLYKNCNTVEVRHVPLFSFPMSPAQITSHMHTKCRLPVGYKCMRSPFKNGGKSSLGIPKSLSSMEFSTISSHWELCHRNFSNLIRSAHSLFQSCTFICSPHQMTTFCIILQLIKSVIHLSIVKNIINLCHGISCNIIHLQKTMRKAAVWLVPPHGISVALSGLCLLK